MQIFAVLVLAFLSLTKPAFAKVFTRCTLAKAMFALGVPKSELPQWTCIAKHESAFRTDIVGSKNSNASNDYGIFQINNLYWCRPENKRFSYNGCKISCKALLRGNIYDSVTCARKIKSQRGWHAWSTWKYCSGSLDSINDCF